MRKSDEPTKHRLSSLIQKLTCYYNLFVVVEKRETEDEKWVHHFSLTERNKNIMRREREQILNSILFFSFSVVVLARACSQIQSSQLRSECGTSSWSSSKMVAVIYGHLHIIASSPHMTLVSCFLSCVYSNSSSAWASFSQWQPVANLLLIDFYF